MLLRSFQDPLLCYLIISSNFINYFSTVKKTDGTPAHTYTSDCEKTHAHENLNVKDTTFM